LAIQFAFLAELINEQQGLYTTVLRGVQDGATVEEFRTISSISRCLNVYTQNGTHTMSVLTAYLYGLDTVEGCIKDTLIFSMMKKGIFKEIIPSMDGDAAQLTQYANDVLERFANPYIKHLLLSISLNSVSKFKIRVLPSLTGYLKKRNAAPGNRLFSGGADCVL
jgi:tagaturonate reductase